jgi:uroporphyrinogen-III synthase
LACERLRPEAGRLLHVAGSDVAGDLAGALRRAGFAVERAVLYEARPAPGLSAPTARALAGGLVDYALFFSPRTAAIFGRLAEQAGIAAALRRVTALSISAAADSALAGLEFRARRIAATPDQRGLLAALDASLAERRRA